MKTIIMNKTHLVQDEKYPVQYYTLIHVPVINSTSQ